MLIIVVLYWVFYEDEDIKFVIDGLMEWEVILEKE